MPSTKENPRAHRARPLGAFERAQLLTSESSPFNLVVCLRIEGPLEKERLRQALDLVQRRHSCLDLRLTGAPEKATFELGDVPPIPLRVLERTLAGSWIDVVEAELALGFDRTAGPLARCSLIESSGSDDPSELVLSFHHVVVDAVSAGHIVESLLELYAADSASKAERPWTIPPRADDRFPKRYRGLSGVWPSCRFLAREAAGEIAYRWRTRALRSRLSVPQDGASARGRVLQFELSKSETENLVSATRRRRLTLNSALNAAFLLAVVRHRYASTDLPHRYFAFPTLRPYLEPPISDHTDGSYLTTLRLTVRASETTDVWKLAAEIQNQIHRADRGGGRFLAAAFSAISMKMILGQSAYRMGTIGLSYTGPYLVGAEAGSLELTGVHAFISNLAVGPEYTVQARIFRGQLWLDVVYLDVDMNEPEALEIAKEARRILVGDNPLHVEAEHGP